MMECRCFGVRPLVSAGGEAGCGRNKSTCQPGRRYAQAYRSQEDHGNRFWPDRHRPSVRIRLFRDSGIKALKEEGYEVVLVNSNPATIMTDPGLADRTYIEPIEPETVAAIVRKERPCAILPTLGGQTGLNTALALAKSGVLAECGTELIGARAEVIEKAESASCSVRRWKTSASRSLRAPSPTIWTTCAASVPPCPSR